MLFLIFILATYGLSYILTQSYLTESFRKKYTKQNKLKYLMNCIVCTSFYTSLILITLYFLTNIYFLYPFTAIGCVKIINSFIQNDFE